MQAVPSPLYQPLRQALLRCAEFGSQRQLDAVFSSIDALSPFWDRLPTADDRAERVDVTIGYLIRNRRSTGENALVLFLRALSGNYDLNNELHGRLIALADQLEWALNLPRKPNREALEANPDQDKMIWTVDVEAMMRAARSVARIAVPRIRDGKESSGDTGTAWMVAPRLAITAWHVIEASRRLDTRAIRQDELDQQVNNALLTFDFTVYGKGIQYKAERIEYPTLATRVLDYAVLRLKDNTDYPLAARGYLRLDLDPALTSQTMLYIIQHPLGQPQQISGDHLS